MIQITIIDDGKYSEQKIIKTTVKCKINKLEFQTFAVTFADIFRAYRLIFNK